MTSRVENILAGSQLMDLNPGELFDISYRLMKRAGMSQATLKAIQNVILLSFDGDDMLTIRDETEDPPIIVRIVDSIPPDGDEDED